MRRDSRPRLSSGAEPRYLSSARLRKGNPGELRSPRTAEGGCPYVGLEAYGDSAMTEFKRDRSHLSYCPPVEKWDDWVEYDAEAWPRRVEKHYQLVPTICFNCESACGLLAYVD